MKIKDQVPIIEQMNIPNIFRPTSPTVDIDHMDELEPKESIKEKEAIFSDLWKWLEKRVYRTNRLKGWINKGIERKEGELIALMHSELSEALEGLRHGNPPSDHIPKVSQAEEEFADVLIRMMDMAYHKKWDIPKALRIKMRFNTKRPYRHGGKKF